MSAGPFLFVIGIVSIAFYVWVTRQKKLHDKVINKIELPEGWKMQRSVPLDVGGVIDLFVEGPDGASYAIQIKTQYQHLAYKKNIFGEHLELPDGRHLKSPCPIDEALSNAQVVGAQAVLWLPFVQKQRPRKTKKGVILVFGPKKTLFGALKIKQPLFGW